VQSGQEGEVGAIDRRTGAWLDSCTLEAEEFLIQAIWEDGGARTEIPAVQRCRKTIWPGRVRVKQPPVLVMTLDQDGSRDQIKWHKIQMMGWQSPRAKGYQELEIRGIQGVM